MPCRSWLVAKGGGLLSVARCRVLGLWALGGRVSIAGMFFRVQEVELGSGQEIIGHMDA